MANAQVDVNVIQPLKSKPIEARKFTVKGGNGLCRAFSSREARWGVLRSWRHPVVWDIEGISHVSFLTCRLQSIYGFEYSLWSTIFWELVRKERNFMCFSFVITLRLETGVWGWIHITWENFGLVVWNINVLAEYSSRISCIRDPCVQTSVQAKLLDKQRLSVTQHALFSLDVQSLISYQHESYLEQWKIVFHFHFSQLW